MATGQDPWQEPEREEAHTGPRQALDNDAMIQLMRRCTEMDVWQRFPTIADHFLTQFDQGKMSEEEMAEEIYLLTLEAERDEDISEAELIRTIYLPPRKRRTHRTRYLQTTPHSEEKTQR